VSSAFFGFRGRRGVDLEGVEVGEGEVKSMTWV
jgi:hypothetical protein